MGITEAGSVVAAILVWSPQGIPLVRDPTKPRPHYLKLPGGNGDADLDRDVVDAVIRELLEETGIEVSRGEVYPIGAEARRNHTITFFMAYVDDLEERGLKEVGDGGEQVSVCPHEKFWGLISSPSRDSDFFEPHRSMLQKPETQQIICSHLPGASRIRRR